MVRVLEMNLSIIIPTLNEAENLKQLLPLLQSCLDGNDEIIVCDAQSTDGSADICREYGVQVLSPKRGRAFQMNAGAKIAKNEILYFVHADTRPPLTFREDVLRYYTQGNKLGCYRFKFDSKSTLLKINGYFTKFDRMMCRGGDQTLFVCKEVFNELKGYDEGHVIMEDYDFLIRARKKHPFVIMNGDAVVSSRKYEENSYFRVNISNFIVFKLYQMGVSPEKLDGIYKRLIKHPKA